MTQIKATPALLAWIMSTARTFVRLAHLRPEHRREYLSDARDMLHQGFICAAEMRGN